MVSFTKDSILDAINTINTVPDVKKSRESIKYDLLYQSSRYPPILVLSQASKLLGGGELNLSDFGNSTKVPFSLLKNLGFSIVKKETELSKELIVDIINLCEQMFQGRLTGQITLGTYTPIFKPQLKAFELQYSRSPSLTLQQTLKSLSFPELNEQSFKFKNFGFWGRSIYNYTWACLYKDKGVSEMAASFSPQLFILVNKEGLKVGFCYGHQVENHDVEVEAALSSSFPLLKQCLSLNRYIGFYNAATDEVTARPEKLFGDDLKIAIESDDDIIQNWSKNSLLIKEFAKDQIPENIADVITNILSDLKPFFLSLFDKKKTNPNLPQHSSRPPESTAFNYKDFHIKTLEAGLNFSEKLVCRFVASLCTKPFVICTGLSGSGKTKLAQSFVHWLCEMPSQYKMIPVGADWTNREPLLGFPNSLDEKRYIHPDSGALQLMLDAEQNQHLPYFLILDEMNLSHVERYFADFLSVMESNDSIKLYSGKEREDIKPELIWPKNLFIIGTVNIDETTYMFSPKVLDRANVIEFRISNAEMSSFLNNPSEINMNKLYSDELLKIGGGCRMSADFLKIAKSNENSTVDLNETLTFFFKDLHNSGAEFGYRTASEFNRLVSMLEDLTSDDKLWDEIDITDDDLIDIAIMQKLLPKLHGTRSRLTKILPVLGGLCLENKENIKEKYFDKLEALKIEEDSNIKFKISFEKICRMYFNATQNGYANYAEA